VIATSGARVTTVFGCRNRLGDLVDPTQTIDLNFVVPAAGTVKRMPVGNNGAQKDVTTGMGPGGQPYFGGQRTMNTIEGAHDPVNSRS
jgi:hypothetical protein